MWALTMRMTRIRLAVSAAGLAVFVSLAVVPMSSLSAYADANPDNPGHHYGWYKHHPSPPPPPPSPRAIPPPTGLPVSAPPVTQVQPGTQGGVGGGEQNAVAKPKVLVQVPTGALVAPQQLPDPDEDWWLVLALALALAVFWLYFFGLLARSLLKTQRRRAAAAQAGQGMVEYALILVLVSIVVIVVLLTMGNQIANVFSNIVAALG